VKLPSVEARGRWRVSGGGWRLGLADPADGSGAGQAVPVHPCHWPDESSRTAAQLYLGFSSVKAPASIPAGADREAYRECSPL
jgi:hypothetical protein